MRGDSHHALLVHAMSGGVHVSVHDIDFRGATPMLGAGRVFSRADLDALVGVLSGVKQEIRILPPYALHAGPEMVALHLPGEERQIMLRDETVVLRTPDLVAAITRKGMRLVAVDAGRPGSNSPVYRAPLPNMTGIDVMCAGNTGFAPRPDMDIEALRDLVGAFLFDTRYTHGLRVSVSEKAQKAMRVGRRPTEEAFFQRFAALTMSRRTFDSTWLESMDMTLSEWLNDVAAEA